MQGRGVAQEHALGAGVATYACVVPAHKPKGLAEPTRVGWELGCAGKLLAQAA